MRTLEFLKTSINMKRKIGNTKRITTILLLSLLLFGTFAFAVSNFASAVGPTTVLLGSAASFSVLAGSGITNTGATTIHGDVGTFPTTSETGFGTVTIVGTNHAGDAVTQLAKTDLLTAYNDAAGRTPVTTVPTELGGTTLTPGVYNSLDGTFGITGTLTLDGQGDPNAVFIFQTQSTLITATSSVVSLINGTHTCNVFWQVGSSATIQTTSTFVGTIMALTSITVNTGATVDGRVLALNGAVTLQGNTIGQTVHLEGITLTPATATNPVGTNHTVTATVAGTGDPVPNRNVNFTVVSGPNAGVTGSAITDSNGHATFTYLGNIAGTDTIQASFENSQGAVVTSSSVTKIWTFSGPAIGVVKQVSVDNGSWVDADLPPGILVTVGSNVYYRFVVTNIGNEVLENITLTDNTYTLAGLIVPPTLAPNESFTYYLAPILSELGQHTNIASVTAQFNNSNFTSTNNANYNGTPSALPAISVVKEISLNNSTWVDANVPPGISVTVGANIHYRFTVTNTGNVALSNITLTDNTYTLIGVVIPSTLAPNASFVYYLGPVQAQVGQHTNTATTTGQYDNITYSNTDNANYNASPTPGPSITVIKWISSDNITWFDANTPPGLNVTAGSNIYFKFEVTNTGNVTLTCITLKDSTYKLCNLVLPSSLAPNVTFTYYLGPVQAQVGQHTDTATATGKYNCKVYCDTDNANYVTPTPTPSIIVTKWVSSDNITWYDANTPPGLNVTAGSNVYFKFEINNTGDVALSCITLKDSSYKLCNLALPSTLAPNATFTYYLGPVQAQKGQHTDTATVSGKYNCNVYCDTDNANYYGAELPKPCIQVIKYVSADGCKWVDANCPPGLTVLAGSCVYFKFEVKNTGNVPLTNISLADVPFLNFSNAGIPNCLKACESFKVVIGPMKVELLLNIDNATVSGIYDNQTYSNSNIAYYYGSLLTYTACEYAGNNGGTLVNCYFKTAFPSGMEIGNYTNIGYGYKWTNDKISNLKLFLKTTGTNGQITSDKLNPSDVKCGGGSLAVQTAALTLNVAFGNLSIKGIPNGFGDLHYCKTGDSLNGKTVTEILAISNSALGGGQLPQGYTYNTLNTLITNLNGAFDNGQPTSWATTYLKVS